jgi:dipeptidase D
MTTTLLYCPLAIAFAQVPSLESRAVAAYADSAYYDATLTTLADLVAFRTVHVEGVANAENPEFRDMTTYLERKADELGLDFADHGEVVVVGLGQPEERLGLVTHGDVQPADPSKWAEDPFSLDGSSEPGRLVGRGAEDDKGPIATRSRTGSPSSRSWRRTRHPT